MKFDRVFAALFFVVMMGIGSLFAYWWFFDQVDPPIVVAEGSSHADRAAYRPGESMHISRRICWNSIRPYATRRAFLDHIVYTLTDFHSAEPALGCHDVGTNIEVPPGLPEGNYVYRVWLDFDINPIRSMRVVMPDINLVVLPAPE